MSVPATAASAPLTPAIPAARSAHTPRASHRAAPRTAIRLFNPLALRLAGTRLLPLWAVMEHRGRRTGKTFRTPVVVRPTADGFVVPLPWGESTDWYRNVRAAGECVVRWKGRDYAMAGPELISDPVEAGAFFNALQRALMPLFGIHLCLRLRHRQPPGAP
jgi:deazaflavin-dependent oxidoreductase (nitroreductase family)